MASINRSEEETGTYAPPEYKAFSWDDPPSYFESISPEAQKQEEAARIKRLEVAGKRRQIKFLQYLKSKCIIEDSEAALNDYLTDRGKRELRNENAGLPHPASQTEYATIDDAYDRAFLTKDQLNQITETQLNMIETPVGDTCQWILVKDAYQNWMEAQSAKDNVLIILGKPAHGKSVLAKSIYLEMQSQKKEVYTFFCKASVSNRSSAFALIALFVYQIFCNHRELFDSDSKVTMQEADSLTFPQLSKIFLDLLSQPQLRDAIFIIDALDECEKSSQSEIVKAFHSYESQYLPKFLITTRPGIYANILVPVFPTLELSSEVVSSDICEFLNHEFEREGITLRYGSGMTSSLKRLIENGSEGMFLVARLWLKEFNRAKDDPEFSTAPEDLEEFFHHKSDLFKDIYSPIVKKIALLSEKRKRMAISLLNIILAAQSSLSAPELDAIFEFSERDHNTYAEYVNATKGRDIFDEALRLCDNLVEVRGNISGPEKWAISIIHPSASEYLDQRERHAYPEAEEQILAQISTKIGHKLCAIACLKFLNSSELTHIDLDSLNAYPVLLYAFNNWRDHVRGSEEMVASYGDLIYDFLSNAEGGYFLWERTLMWIQNDYEPTEDNYKPKPLPHILLDHKFRYILDEISLDNATSAPTLFGNILSIDALDEYGWTALALSIYREEFDISQKLLRLGASAHMLPGSNVSPVVMAVHVGSKEFVGKLAKMGALEAETVQFEALCSSIEVSPGLFPLLLELGCNTYKDETGFTILHSAAENDRYGILKSVCETGLVSDVDCTNANADTPLLCAVVNGSSLDVIKYLVQDCHADVNVRSTTGWTECFAAAALGQTDIVKFLLTVVENKHSVVQGYNALSFAASNGHLETLKVLIQEELDLNLPDEDGDTPLMQAIMNRHWEIASYLIAHDANVNAVDNVSRPAIFKACQDDHIETVCKLLEKGANTYPKTEGLMSCLHVAAWRGCLAIVKLIVEARGPSGTFDEIEQTSEWTPLMASIQNERADVAKYLLDFNQDFNLVTKGGFTYLHAAIAKTRDQELVNLLFSKTATHLISLPTDQGWTPLHTAARRGFFGAIESLLKQNVDGNVYSTDNCTPLYYAACSESVKSINLLMDYGSLPDAQAKWGWTALHAASKYCHDVDTVKKIISRTNWRSRSRSAATPLELAILFNTPEVVLALLDAGMPVDFANSFGTTPLALAASIGNEFLIKELLARGATVDCRSAVYIQPYFLMASSSGLSTNVISSLRPKSGTIWRLNHSLLNPGYRAGSCSLGELKWLEANGCRTWLRDACNNTDLTSAVWDNKVEILEYLLLEPRNAVSLNTPSFFDHATPLHVAARLRSLDTLRVLVLKNNIDVFAKDAVGKSALDYCQGYRKGLNFLLSVAQERFPDKAVTWLQEKKQNPGVNRQAIFQHIHRLLSWKVSNLQGTSVDPFQELDQAQATVALVISFHCIGEWEDRSMAVDQLMGLPGSRLLPKVCEACWSSYGPPFLENGTVWDPVCICRTCPVRWICSVCRDRSRVREVSGCFSHIFDEFPTKSWFTRNTNSVNEEGQTELEWLKTVQEKYSKELRDDFDLSSLPEIFPAYSADRSSVFALSQTTDLSQLVTHLELYPRDVALVDEAGENLAFKMLRLEATEHDIRSALETLASEGLMLLSYNLTGISTVQLACEREFPECLSFLLSLFSPGFDEHKDTFASKALRMMIQKKMDFIARIRYQTTL